MAKRLVVPIEMQLTTRTSLSRRMQLCRCNHGALLNIENPPRPRNKQYPSPSEHIINHKPSKREPPSPLYSFNPPPPLHSPSNPLLKPPPLSLPIPSSSPPHLPLNPSTPQPTSSPPPPPPPPTIYPPPPSPSPTSPPPPPPLAPSNDSP